MKHGLMKSAAIAALVLVTAPASAQQGGMNHQKMSGGGMGNMGQMSDGMQMGGKPEMMQMMMQMMQMMMQMNGGDMGDMGAMGQMGGMGQIPATEPGQGAFAAIGEIVAALQADPNTDWESVDINALREHLRDMDQVIIDAEATAMPIPGGMKFDVAGEGRVREAIQRMVVGHANVMQGVNGWEYTAEATDTGATLEVRVPEADMAKLKGLGFFGIITSGMHHQPHHWAMATGAMTDM